MSILPPLMSNGKLKATLLAATVMACLVLLPCPASAKDVIIIKEAEIKPFRDAIEGFKSSCGCRAEEVAFSDKNLLKRIEKARPSAVFVVGTQAFEKATAITDVPVIYTMVMPSEEAFLPADNVSGVRMDVAPETWLKTMTALFPGVKRIGVLSDPELTGPLVRDAAAAARALGITLVVKSISDPRHAPELLNEFQNEIDLFWMLPDPTVVTSETLDYLMLFSFQNNLPVFSFSKKYVKNGAAAALAIDPFDMGVQAGEQYRTLSKGGKGPLRAYARTSRLIVNRKVITKMKVQTSGEMLQNAESVE
ncbi:MAG TPA: ABC transporter substrate binding protein [Nitrospirota bacterium]|nr:ABC transporter substrate binding protein [Nitrospirota bacterium]